MITTIKTVGDKVVQKITKPDGSLVRFQYGTIGEPLTPAATLQEACIAIEPMQVKVVDRKGDKVVKKVTKPDGKLQCYMALCGDAVIGETGTLAEARSMIAA